MKVDKLGWCLTGHHAGRKLKYSKPCPGQVQSLKCGCACHGTPVKKTTKKRNTKRRKKGKG